MTTKRTPKLIPFLAATALVGGLAVVGTATSASADRHVTGSDVKNSSLTGADIKNGSLTGADIKASSISGGDIKNGSLTGADIKASSISGGDIKNSSLGGADIRNGSLSLADLSKSTRSALTGKTGKTGKTGATGEAGPQGEAGAPGKDGENASVEHSVAETVTIENIGGKFADRATTVGTVEVEAGTYLVNTYGVFDRTDNTEPSTPVLQLAVRAADGTKWGQDLGTAFTGEFPESGDLEQSASAVRYVTIAEDTTVTVHAFGYNANTSSNGAGNYTVAADVTLVKIG